MEKEEAFLKSYAERVDEFMNTIMRRGDDPFFSKVVEEFPEIESGGFAPDATISYEMAMRHVLVTWLGSNIDYPDDSDNNMTFVYYYWNEHTIKWH